MKEACFHIITLLCLYAASNLDKGSPATLYVWELLHFLDGEEQVFAL